MYTVKIIMNLLLSLNLFKFCIMDLFNVHHLS